MTLGTNPPVGPASGIFVCLPIGRDAALTCALFERHGLSASPCVAPGPLLRALDEKSGVLMIGQEVLTAELSQRVRDRLDDQPPWSELPVLVLAGARRKRPLAQCLLEHRNVKVLARPIESRTLLAVVSTALESRKRQFGIRTMLRKLERLNQRLERRTRQVQALAERYHSVVNTAADAIVTVDAEQRIDTFNLAAEHIFGYRAEEVCGESSSLLFAPDDREALVEWLATVMEYEYSMTRNELRGRHKSGRTFPMDFTTGDLGNGGLTVILRDISERQAAVRRISEIAIEERKLLARELHDGVSGQMTGVSMLIRTLERQLQAEGSPHADEVADLTKQIKEAHALVRGISHGLMPVENDPEGLMTALERLAESLLKSSEIVCLFECEHAVLIDDLNVATHLYYIVQEAVANAITHGRAKRVVIRLALEGDRPMLEVRDNGVGIGKVADSERGLGMVTMRERARLIDGLFRIGSAKGGGTIVTCKLRRVGTQAWQSKTPHPSGQSLAF